MRWLTAFSLAALAAAGPASPFACNPFALTPAERRSHFEQVGPRLCSLVRGVRDLPDGYAFAFPANPETKRLLAQWAAEESACCPFFDITIRMPRESGRVELVLTGREGTKAFLRDEFAGAWFSHAPGRRD